MNRYETIEQRIELAGDSWTLTTLADRQQFYDPNGAFETAGVAPAAWSLFGVVWPAGLLLAEIMAREPIAGRSILEAGCGLGLASLVTRKRGGDVLATDLHPLAGEFLERNARNNDVAPVSFETIDWRQSYPSLPAFDLVIGSDLLYESGQPQLLADFVARHTRPGGQVIITDPGRKQVGTFNRLMEAKGFSYSETAAGKSRIVRFQRSTASHQGASSTT